MKDYQLAKSMEKINRLIKIDDKKVFGKSSRTEDPVTNNMNTLNEYKNRI